ncbi:hypothetical protein HK099_002398, partial [Clydaea vesicula]
MDVKDIDFGKSAPRLNNETEMEVEWDGDLNFSLDLQMLGGKTYPSLVVLTYFKSKMRLRLPSKISPYKIDVVFDKFEGEDFANFKIDIDKNSEGMIEESLNKVVSKMLIKIAHNCMS